MKIEDVHTSRKVVTMSVDEFVEKLGLPDEPVLVTVSYIDKEVTISFPMKKL